MMNNLSYLGVIQVTGADAKKLLQGQFTCDLNLISDTETRLGAHCNPQGRVISLFRIFYSEENYYLIMPRATIPIALTALKKYAVFFKVNLSDASENFYQIGYDTKTAPPYFKDRLIAIDQLFKIKNTHIIRVPGQEYRYHVLGQKNILKELIDEYPPLTEIQWKYLEITAGLCHIYPETSEKYLPHEMNLHEKNAISFNKGCYTGQEIIARMHYRGKLKKHLEYAILEKKIPPQRGCDNLNIVDYCEIDENHYASLIITSQIEHKI